MEQNRADQTRNVRVRYEPGEYGLALSIYDVLEDDVSEHNTDKPVTPETDEAQDDGSTAFDEDEGVLTVIKTGVTTLELRRNEGEGPSLLIWDDSEVDWASVQAS